MGGLALGAAGGANGACTSTGTGTELGHGVACRQMGSFGRCEASCFASWECLTLCVLGGPHAESEAKAVQHSAYGFKRRTACCIVLGLKPASGC